MLPTPLTVALFVLLSAFSRRLQWTGAIDTTGKFAAQMSPAQGACKYWMIPIPMTLFRHRCTTLTVLAEETHGGSAFSDTGDIAAAYDAITGSGAHSIGACIA